MSKLAMAMRQVADLYEAHGIDGSWATISNGDGTIVVDCGDSEFRTMFAGMIVRLSCTALSFWYEGEIESNGILFRASYIKHIDRGNIETSMVLPVREAVR